MKPHPLTMKAVLASFLIIALTGCSYFPKPAFLETHDRTYLSARSIPPLRVPPGISSASFQTAYPIPYRSYPESAKDVSIVPPGLNG